MGKILYKYVDYWAILGFQEKWEDGGGRIVEMTDVSTMGRTNYLSVYEATFETLSIRSAYP